MSDIAFGSLFGNTAGDGAESAFDLSVRAISHAMMPEHLPAGTGRDVYVIR